MFLYDSLTGQKKELKQPAKGPINLFVCGPTVYDQLHIGNFRTGLLFDTLVHYLRQNGHKIFYLQNITDIDDKIINRAQIEKNTVKKVAAKYISTYHQDEKLLGINTVTKYALATKYIKPIIRQVQTLIDKGYAYKLDDGYYFDIAKFSDYGQLSKRTVLQAEDGVSRIDENIKKHNKGDFNLWKFSQANEPSWPSPLGTGRPGWHIEDTAITEYHFGPQYDWHGAGIDLKFPHHEAEIAQQEAASGKKPLVKIWSHGGALTINGQKMSKSLGNFVTVQDFLGKYDARLLRFIFLTHHYRSPLNYTEQLAIEARTALTNIDEFLAKLALITKTKNIVKNFSYENEFATAINNDFNTPEALAAVFKLINDFNPQIWQLDKKTAGTLATWIKAKLSLLKISPPKQSIPAKIKALAKKRELLRVNQQFTQADTLRKQIEGLGYSIEDTPKGPLVLKSH